MIYLKINIDLIYKEKELLKEQLREWEERYRNTEDEFYKKSFWRQINRCQASLDTLNWMIYNGEQIKLPAYCKFCNNVLVSSNELETGICSECMKHIEYDPR